MNIDSILGLPMEVVGTNYKDNVISVNSINKTIELKGIKTQYDKLKHNVLLYFDLINPAIMTMAVIKFEHMNFFTRIDLMKSNRTKCKEYVKVVTLNGSSASLAYIHEKIIKNM